MMMMINCSKINAIRSLSVCLYPVGMSHKEIVTICITVLKSAFAVGFQNKAKFQVSFLTNN
jgi:hypothetical protein